MRLVAEDRISLDEPILPRLAGFHLPLNGHDGNGVTLRALLSHTAGLPRGNSPQFPDRASVPPLEELLRTDQGVRIELVADPGTVFAYSNPGYALIELLIEKLTGASFAEWATRAVLEPLGMSESSFVPSSEQLLASLRPHRRIGAPMPETVFGYLASGGLWSTAADLFRLASAMGPGRRGGGILPPELVETMWSSPPPAQKLFLRNGGYGLGQIWGSLTSGTRFVANQGSRPGWRSLLVSLPDKSSALVVLTNANSGLPLAAHVALSWLRRREGESLRPWRLLSIPRRQAD